MIILERLSKRIFPDKPQDTARAAKRIERVLTPDPGMGIVRHVDAGHRGANEMAREFKCCFKTAS